MFVLPWEIQYMQKHHAPLYERLRAQALSDGRLAADACMNDAAGLMAFPQEGAKEREQQQALWHEMDRLPRPVQKALELHLNEMFQREFERVMHMSEAGQELSIPAVMPGDAAEPAGLDEALLRRITAPEEDEFIFRETPARAPAGGGQNVVSLADYRGRLRERGAAQEPEK
jgi:hypothetical protein